MKRLWICALALAIAACERSEPIDYGAVFGGSAGRWVDLTHPFGPSTIYWPTDTAGFRLTSSRTAGRTAAGSTPRTSSRRPSTGVRTSTRRSTSRRGG